MEAETVKEAGEVLAMAMAAMEVAVGTVLVAPNTSAHRCYLRNHSRMGHCAEADRTVLSYCTSSNRSNHE